ncbi:MAG: hypothetical protein QNI99_06970 [Woeseiaceae bacterium]|nr:hypothetical protein [Woeseiaceae bacterium]
MSEDRNNGIGDSAVSDTYRDVATERAPASLNEAVLRNAAAHASKGYAHSMLWIRPLAYAATVVLSLGIVVQVVLPPAADTELPAASVSPAADAAELAPDADLGFADAGIREQAAEDDDPLKRLRDQEAREESKIEEFAEPAVAAEIAPVVAATEASAAVDTGERLRAGDPAQLPEVLDEEPAVAAYAAVPPDSNGFEAAALRSEAGIQEASNMAALRSVQLEDYNSAAALGAPAEASVCEPADIESPDTWMDCIERLEEGGQADDAVREKTLLMEAFPDFEWPAE